MATIKQIKDSAGTTHDIVDTKNTAGSTNSSSKLFLIGATEQAANKQTYSNSKCYTSNGRLYSSGITSTDNLVLSNSSSEPPKIIFQRNTDTDNWYDFQLSGGSGGFKFGYSSTSGQGTVNNIATIDTSGNYSGNAATATTASKLGTSTVGSTKRPIYLNAGTPTVCNVGESFLSWGGANFAASWGPIDAAMIPELGSNRLEYYPGSKIKIEYSKDNGSTWSVSTASETIKSQIFSSGYRIYLGGSDATKIDKSQYQTRIILTTKDTLYSTLNKFAINVTTSGSSNCWCSIDVRLQSNVESNTNTWVNVANQVTISGWSGWNIININEFTTYGNQTDSQYGEIRFTFGATHSSSSIYPGLTINKIKGFGGVGWTTPSNKALKGTIYTEQYDQSTVWPNTLYPSSNKTIDLGTIGKYWNNIYASHLYIGGTKDNTTSKITSNTPTNMYISVNGTDPFVIDASNTSNPIIRASESLSSKVSLGTSTVPFKDVYADKFNGYTIEKSVPSNAVFTDYQTTSDGHYTPSEGTTMSPTDSGRTLRFESPVITSISTDTKGHITNITTNKLPQNPNTDTKNTAGSTDSSSKLYLIGAESQAANPQTYSHDTAYVGTDGCLYSNSQKVITVSDTVTTTTDGIMTSEDKTKLNGIEENANNYTHPTTAGNRHIPSGGSSGQYLKFSGTGSAGWASPSSNIATTSAAGFMSSADKTKLDGIATNANNYSLPTAKFNTLGGLKPAYTSTGSATLTTTSASNTNTPTISPKSTEQGRYFAVEADTNGIPYVNVPEATHRFSYTISNGGGLSSAAALTYVSGSNSYDDGSIIRIDFNGNDGAFIHSPKWFKYTKSGIQYNFRVGRLSSSGTFVNATDEVSNIANISTFFAKSFALFRVISIYSNIDNGNVILMTPIYCSSVGQLSSNSIVSENINVSPTADNSSYNLLFTSNITAGSIGEYKTLYTDSNNSLYYNPSTNTLTVPNASITTASATTMKASTIANKTSNSTIMFNDAVCLKDYSYTKGVFSCKGENHNNYGVYMTGGSVESTPYLSVYHHNNNSESMKLVGGNATDAPYISIKSANNNTTEGIKLTGSTSSVAPSISIKSAGSDTESIKLTGRGITGGRYTAALVEVVGGSPGTYTLITGGSSSITTSDERLKNFKDDVEVDFDKLKQIPKKYFTWKDGDQTKLEMGTSAQEVEKLYPNIVQEIDGYKSIEYAKLSIIALAAIDKLNERIVELENKIKELEQA